MPTSEKSARATLSPLVSTKDHQAVLDAARGDETALGGMSQKQIERVVDDLGREWTVETVEELIEREESMGTLSPQVEGQTGLQDVGAGEGEQPEGAERSTPQRREREGGQMDIETAAATERLETGVGPAGSERQQPTEIESERREPDQGAQTSLSDVGASSGQQTVAGQGMTGGDGGNGNGNGDNGSNGFRSERMENAHYWAAQLLGWMKNGPNAGVRGTYYVDILAGQPSLILSRDNWDWSRARSLMHSLADHNFPMPVEIKGDNLGGIRLFIEEPTDDRLQVDYYPGDWREFEARGGAIDNAERLFREDQLEWGIPSPVGESGNVNGGNGGESGNAGGDDGGRSAEPSGLAAFEGEGVDRPDAETVARRIRERSTTDPTAIEDCDGVRETLAAAMEAVAEGAPARREQVGDDPVTEALADVRKAARSAMGDHHCMSASTRHRYFAQYRHVDRRMPAVPATIENLAADAAEWYRDPENAPDPHHSFRELTAEISALDPPDPPGSGRTACASLWDWWGWRDGPIQILSHVDEAYDIKSKDEGSVFGNERNLRKAWGEFSREYLRKVDDAGCLDRDPDFSIDDLREGLERVGQEFARPNAGDPFARAKDVDRLIRDIQLPPPERVGNQTIAPWNQPEEAPSEPDTATPSDGPLTTVDVTIPVSGDDLKNRNAGGAFTIMIDANGRVTDRRSGSTSPPTEADVRDTAADIVGSIVDKQRAIGMWYPERFPVDIARAYPRRGDDLTLNSITLNRGLPVATDVAETTAIDSTDDLQLDWIRNLEATGEFVDDDVEEEDDDPFGPSISGHALQGQADLEGGHAEEGMEPGPVEKLQRIDRPDELAGWVEDKQAAGKHAGGKGNIVYRGPRIDDDEWEFLRLYVEFRAPTIYVVHTYPGDETGGSTVGGTETIAEAETPGEAWDAASEYMRSNPVDETVNDNVNDNTRGESDR